jgi:hypothetical protein
VLRQLLYIAGCGVAVSTAFPGLAAQTWRTFDVGRQARDTSLLAVHLQYGAGRVSVHADPQTSLYNMHLRYDAERSDPVYHFDGANHQLEVGVKHTSSGRNMHSTEGGELTLALGKTTPMRLALDVGAAQGDFDLTGLKLEEFTLQTGASDTKLKFDAPNALRMRTLRLEVGAADVQATGLGNANAEHVDVDLGVGHLALDFGGVWRGDMDMTVNSALGDITLSIPADVAIRVESSAFLHSLDAAGLTKKGNYWTTDNWDTARYKLRLRSSGALGQLTIKRIAR